MFLIDHAEKKQQKESAANDFRVNEVPEQRQDVVHPNTLTNQDQIEEAIDVDILEPVRSAEEGQSEISLLEQSLILDHIHSEPDSNRPVPRTNNQIDPSSDVPVELSGLKAGPFHTLGSGSGRPYQRTTAVS